MDKVIKIGVPSLLLVALIVVCLVNPFAKDESDSNSTDTSTDTTTYSTDTSLTVKDGDTVEVNVTFPENYGNEELNGKDALFVVEVNGIY